MKKIIFYLALALATGIIFGGCGGGDGSSGSSGTASMNVTDAKPVLPAGVLKVLITFDEVSVHKSGGGWTSLPLPKTPFEIDLYQFIEGKTTQLVPPVQLESGKYTQVRIGVISATLVTSTGNYPMQIPSENLKTDKNFEFTVVGGGAVDLTVDFDLSQSIVVTGTGTYQLKPVLHIVDTKEAATIKGTINWGSSTEEEVTVIVTWNKYNPGTGTCQEPNLSDPNTDEVYTKILVQKTDPSPFQIFWLVPGEGYFVQALWGNPNDPASCSNPIYVGPGALGSGAVYDLGTVNPS
jgi:hypothetical protein